ncbi:MAG TPA: outer-membrane lipoprotein carrier protein LolA [Pyrinomonadaceae bacterium]|jgi:outer membrane lipoprotein-sorting protein
MQKLLLLVFIFAFSTVAASAQTDVIGEILKRMEVHQKTAKSYKTLDLWVDGNGMPLQSKITEDNGDWTTVLLGNLKKNEIINASIFTIKLPKETKIIKN